jgi:hypothetical protein
LGKRSSTEIEVRRASVVLVVLLLSSCANPIEDIQSPDSRTRIEAASRLGRDASPAEIEQLIEILKATDDHGVRAACADALGYAKATRAVPALIEALKIPEWRVRRSTARALGNIADPRAVDPLLDVLRTDPADANLSEGRRSAVYAFVKIKSARAVPVLIHLLKHNPGYDESERIDYTTALLAALAAQGDRRAIPAVAALLDGRSAVRAAGALGQIVGADFTDDHHRGVPLPSPGKAKAWLTKHPELLRPTEEKPNGGPDTSGTPTTRPDEAAGWIAVRSRSSDAYRKSSAPVVTLAGTLRVEETLVDFGGPPRFRETSPDRDGKTQLIEVPRKGHLRIASLRHKGTELWTDLVGAEVKRLNGKRVEARCRRVNGALVVGWIRAAVARPVASLMRLADGSAPAAIQPDRADPSQPARAAAKTEPVRLALAGPAAVTVGKLCPLTVTFINDTKVPVWCRVPAVTRYEGPMGFQPDGKHISPLRKKILQKGLACSLVIAPRPRAVRGGPVRRWFGSGKGASGWARVGPGERRRGTVYFNGNVLQGDAQKQPVCAVVGEHLLKVTLDYRTAPDGPVKTVASAPLRIEVKHAGNP